MKYQLLASALTLAFTCAAADGNWPQFRGPSGSGLGDGTHPAVQWDTVKGTNVLWTSEIPGLSVSSPAIWGDRIYLTTAISSDAKQTFRTGLYGDTDSAPDRSPHQWKVLALDKKTGKPTAYPVPLTQGLKDSWLRVRESYEAIQKTQAIVKEIKDGLRQQQRAA